MQKRSTKWYRKNEAEVMHRLGLKPTKDSGAGWIEKCDGENEHFLCELKSTDHESFSIKQSVLHVLEHHALEAHKIPLFAFQFINRDEVWVAIKEEDSEFLKKYKICKKGIDNQSEEEYYKGEKERGGFEAVSFMPNTDKLNNLDSNSTNRNSNTKQSINVIDVNKVKHNINARNNYFKQKEQERRKQEQKFRTERRKTK